MVCPRSACEGAGTSGWDDVQRQCLSCHVCEGSLDRPEELERESEQNSGIKNPLNWDIHHQDAMHERVLHTAHIGMNEEDLGSHRLVNLAKLTWSGRSRQYGNQDAPLSQSPHFLSRSDNGKRSSDWQSLLTQLTHADKRLHTVPQAPNRLWTSLR